eukprot:TRINITY_DN8352_c0_g1_i1.p1 TRINITY_DN8352_c0_g1~~TRINITY_DN8352_c0_g1_i1.p1  ORF type:complete len:205 (+),score=47.68 TRINITY_DN8352_c0_g1_i1:106-720(+)
MAGQQPGFAMTPQQQQQFQDSQAMARQIASQSAGAPRTATAAQVQNPAVHQAYTTSTQQAQSSMAATTSVQAAAQAAAQRSEQNSQSILPLAKIDELLQQIDPNQKIDDAAKQLVADMAHDFIERVVTFSCKLARHRGSTQLEAKDLLLHLERNWNIRIPGVVTEDVRPNRYGRSTDAHQKRVEAAMKGRKRVKRNDGASEPSA